MFFLYFLYVAQKMEMKVVSVGKHGRNLIIQNRKSWYHHSSESMTKWILLVRKINSVHFDAQDKSLLNYMLYVYIIDLKC